jgi:hypothetical protein
MEKIEQQSISYYLGDKSDLHKKSEIASYTEQDLTSMILITSEVFRSSCFVNTNLKNGMTLNYIKSDMFYTWREVSSTRQIKVTDL